jgi:hypothetical protein
VEVNKSSGGTIDGETMVKDRVEVEFEKTKDQRTYIVDALLLTIRPPLIPYVAVGDGEGW